MVLGRVVPWGAQPVAGDAAGGFDPSDGSMNDSQKSSTLETSPSRSRRSRSTSWGLLVAFLAVAGAGTTVACERSAGAGPSESEGKASAASNPTTQVAAAPDAGPQGQGSYREEGFVLTLEAPESVDAGKPAEAKVILEAKDPYKVNQEYPIKFALKESSGLTFPSATVGKESVTLEPKKAVLKVALTPKAAGKHELAGRLSFSVCTEERCLIEKRELAVPVVVR